MIYDVNYWLFGDLPENIPPDYCDANPAGMIACQSAKIDRHMRHYDDCYIPFLMPWYGTGVLASGFGVPMKFPDRMDPAADPPTIWFVAWTGNADCRATISTPTGRGPILASPRATPSAA